VTKTRWAKKSASRKPDGTPYIEVIAYDGEEMEVWQHMTEAEAIELADDIYAVCGVERCYCQTNGVWTHGTAKCNWLSNEKAVYPVGIEREDK
jgi:hypothetical protein